MPKLATHNSCTGCMLCSDVCPHKAISFHDINGFSFPNIDYSKCVECKLCEKKCPEISSLSPIKNIIIPPVGGWSKNVANRINSASGGAFIEIALRFIDICEQNNKKWNVIGAAIENKTVKLINIKDKKDLYKLQGTKYLSSDASSIYMLSYKLLAAGESVLFSGLPCQVNALYYYLSNKKYQGNLLTCDLICNGVPSNKLISLTLPKVDEIKSFRDKKNGWGHTTAITYIKKGVEHREVLSQNFFLKALCANYLMRKSCYNCKHCTIVRNSDFTIGDWWGCTLSEEEKYMGVSLIIPHNNKSIEFLRSCNLYTIPVRWEDCLPGNPRIFNGKRFIGHAIPNFIKVNLDKFNSNIVFKLLTGELNIISQRNYFWIPFKLWLIFLHKLENKERRIKLKTILNIIYNKNENK